MNSLGEFEELKPGDELTVRNSHYFPASILQDTSENTIGSNASTGSNGSINNANIKIENSNSYYCNNYGIQTAPPAITSVSGAYSKS